MLKNRYSFRVLSVFYGVLLAILLLSVTFAITAGPVNIHPLTVWRIVLSHFPGGTTLVEADWSVAHYHIIWDIRFPRVLLAAVVGAGLSICGVAIQALVRNSLADPYILGVSSGASVGATLVILLGAFSVFGQYALSMAAFLGSLLSLFLVLLLSRVKGRMSTTRILLAGIAVSMILSAVTNYIVISAPREEAIKNALYWMLGNLSGAKWIYLPIPSVVIGVGFIYLLLQYRNLNLLLMGEETAGSMGVDVERFRIVLVLIVSLMTGVLVAVSGSIGFVGLMIPHIARLLVGSNHIRVLPFSMLIGAIFLIWCDVVARIVLDPQELPIGIVTAICGGPFFIWLLRRGSYSFGGGGE
ncbi:ABC transporter permease [Bacillus coahuilensis p1.1.43]|uniref:ABC transporter permease n=1 Tax=Bacillus coahuilensis p1.1.43 TaxID=1150625 RepID=A0A147KCK6_9BACI|nr:iron ABC transporter permease [Bacillus coahuilensis]KUP09436.1 ABC transporter permease [Bacillus coahuilensis p1.1.43]